MKKIYQAAFTNCVFLCFVILIFYHQSIGQGFNNTIYFDEKGKLKGEVPELIDAKVDLQVYISADEEYSKDTIQFNKILDNAKTHLSSASGNGPLKKFYEVVYGINQNTIISQLQEIESLKLTIKPTIERKYKINSQPSTYSELQKKYSIELKKLENSSAIFKYPIELAKTDPLKKLIFQKLNDSKESYKGIDYKVLKSLIDTAEKVISENNSLIKEYDEFVKKYRANKPIPKNEANDWMRKFSKKLKAHSEKIGSFNNEIEAFFNKVKENKDWILTWLWYTGGKPTLNPFPFCDPEEYIFPKDIDTLDIKSKKERIEILNAMIKSLGQTNEKGLRIIDSLIVVRDTLIRKVTREEFKLAKFKKAVKSNNAKIEGFRVTQQKINSITLYATNKDKSEEYAYMRHHDASEEYELMNSLTNDEYLEEDRIIVLSHNLKKGEKSNFSIKEEEITDDSPEYIKDARAVIKSLKIDEILKLFGIPDPSQKDQSGIWNNLDTEIWQSYIGIYGQIKENAIKLQQNLAYLKQVPIETKPFIAVQEKHNDSSIFHSVVDNKPKKVKGTKKVSYSFFGDVNEKDKPPKDIYTYRVNSLYRILPVAGFGYTPTRFVDVTYNKSAEPIIKQEIIQPIHYIFGLKVHPFRKIDIRNTEWLFGEDDKGRRLFLSRVSLTAAFDVQDPLKNLYSGLGIDIYPGFCLNIGAHFNQYNQINFESGNVINKNIYRTGFYFGILTDPGLVADIMKLFVKK